MFGYILWWIRAFGEVQHEEDHICTSVTGHEQWHSRDHWSPAKGQKASETLEKGRVCGICR